MTEEDYYYGMRENLTDLSEAIDNGEATEEIIEIFLSQNRILTYDFKNGLKLSLYRARFDSGFDKTDSTQFGYIHNLAAITQYRYNRANEAVLYTSTHPRVAYDEIVGSRKGESHFYLSIWSHKNGARSFNCALNINGKKPRSGSTAEKYYSILKNNVGYGPKLDCFCLLGRMLEKEGTDYRVTSSIASKLFSSHDALITTSLKSQGGELNVTFNQNAADNLLELKYIYRCEVPQNAGLVFHVDEIGLPMGSKIEWHKWQVNNESIRFLNPQGKTIDIKALRKAIQSGKGFSHPVMYPNVNSAPDDWHIGTAEYNNIRYELKFKIDIL